MLLQELLVEEVHRQAFRAYAKRWRVVDALLEPLVQCLTVHPIHLLPLWSVQTQQQIAAQRCRDALGLWFVCVEDREIAHVRIVEMLAGYPGRDPVLVQSLNDRLRCLEAGITDASSERGDEVT